MTAVAGDGSDNSLNVDVLSRREWCGRPQTEARACDGAHRLLRMVRAAGPSSDDVGAVLRG